jgi:mannose-1-phosphate guanylyltransferase
LLKGSIIKSHSWINESIVGWNSTVGKWVKLILKVRIEGTTVLGEDV